MKPVSQFLLVVFITLLLGSDLPAGEPIKVMSFNIRYGSANDGKNHWRLRKELVAQTIKEFSPDILGTQETMGFQATFLKENLKAYAAIGRSREKDPKQGEQCTLFYLKDRFKRVKDGQFWLSETPDRIASKSWDSSLPRIATWVLLEDRKNKGRKFLFMNTHFDHRGSQARLESAKLIARKWDEMGHPGILTGDFNCGEGSKPYQALIVGSKSKLQDTFRIAQPKRLKNEGTFNGFRGTSTGARIDWILTTPEFRTESAQIIHFNREGKYPSDHFPVSAVLQLK